MSILSLSKLRWTCPGSSETDLIFGLGGRFWNARRSEGPAGQVTAEWTYEDFLVFGSEIE